MGLESIKGPRESRVTRETGLKISSMDQGGRNGRMEVSLLECMCNPRSKA